jgi:carbon storage regulator CsrA
MLVLSRRPNQDIVFPNTGIRIRVLRLQGNVVRIGIEAPPDVQILRQEIAPADGQPAPARPALSHALRNRLNKVTLGLFYFNQQRMNGQEEQANATFRRVIDILDSLDQDWPSPQAPAVAAPKRLRTLLVEDDANERELLAGILGMNGCECETAADGQDALDYLASHEPPDVVLLDMSLPRVPGPQILERIRREPRSRGTRVFAVSGTPASELGIPTGPDGVDAWFSKPLNPSRLWQAIQESLAKAAN